MPILKAIDGDEVKFEDLPTYMFNIDDLTNLLDNVIRVTTLRISYSFVECIGKTSGRLIYNLVLKLIEQASFLSEIEFSCGYLSAEDIVRFIDVVGL